MRWVGHCAYGSILRIHGADHRAWTYDNHTVNVVRSYLNARYHLAPSLIAAGQRATATGFPLVARGDLYWPDHPESASNQQYIFLDDILVAPIVESDRNVTARSVWVPPGDWEDAWDGTLVTGPKSIEVSQPYERLPMWHRRGGLLVLTPEPTAPIDDQDWSTLVLEAFPAATKVAQRSVVERRGTERTDLELRQDKDLVQLHINATPGIERSWLLRVHLQPAVRAVAITVDGVNVHVQHIAPAATGGGPLGPRTAPALGAGSIVEVPLPAAKHERLVEMKLEGVKDFIV